jgi:signal transduction histidine kinase
MTRRRILGLGGASAALVALVVWLDLAVHPEQNPPNEVWSTIVFASAWILAGLIGWARRPGNRCGPLMTAAGWGWLLSYLNLDEPVSFTLASLLGGVGVAFVVHLFVVFPDGRPRTRFAQLVVGCAYLAWVVLAGLTHLFWNPAGDCPACPRNLVFAGAHPALSTVLGLTTLAVMVFAVVSASVLQIRRWRRATRPGRRVLTPVVWTGAVATAAFLTWILPAAVFHLTSRTPVFVALAVATEVAGAAVPLGFLVGLLRTRLHHAVIADLVVELARGPALAQPRDAIARAFGDPGLQLGFWLPEQHRYVDFEGREMPLPAGDPHRAVTLLESGNTPLAALVHDPSLLEDRTLLNAVGSAARLALENARLHAELQARLAEVRASRARIMEASDAERRRIERNLHDGAQQHLLGVRLALRLARSRLRDTAALETLIGEADTEVAAAIDEVRRLARGIHPAVLSEAGLRPALLDLARRSPVPVTVTAPPGRLPAPVEAAAYFVVAESLANIAKHARASTATVDVRRADGQLVVEVSDDGVGGATTRRGTGLPNMQDRVAALEGTLSVDSRDGAGTVIRAVIPCG